MSPGTTIAVNKWWSSSHDTQVGSRELTLTIDQLNLLVLVLCVLIRPDLIDLVKFIHDRYKLDLHDSVCITLGREVELV